MGSVILRKKQVIRIFWLFLFFCVLLFLTYSWLFSSKKEEADISNEQDIEQGMVKLFVQFHLLFEIEFFNLKKG